MQPIHTTYPQFAPNQILSSSHLNQLYDYLGEQGRLTRTHLIGIGIVCGLEATLNQAGSGITISRGCGVTSAGHLIIWDEDEPLEFFAPYTMPEDIDYTFFDLPDGDGTYPLWELTTDRNDNAAARAVSRDFLTGTNQSEGEGDEKVLLLLFECRAVDNRNCTPNNCDDKGRTVETIVKPLLIRRQDLVEIRRVLATDVPGAATYYSLFDNRADRLALPTLRAARFNVPNTHPLTTRQLFETYRATLSGTYLSRIQTALDQSYTSLAPLFPGYAANPFSARLTGLTFLHDGRLLQGAEALAYQYYFDHLATIVHAYEELREGAEDLFSLCCPDDRIFPRHLVLNHFTTNGLSDEMRHVWVSSPVQNQQAESRQRLVSLFDRLVALVLGTQLPVPAGASPPTVGNLSGIVMNRVRRLRGVGTSNNRLENPAELPLASTNTGNVRRPIRITPSFLGRPLSRKAIPFYYDPQALVNLWNYHLTRKGRAGENLGYHAVQWNATDDFVRRPLIYDLEPRQFLRIEGAVGQAYQTALAEIRQQIRTYRLPIDVVALRTGDLADDMVIEDYRLHFSDLEAQYGTLRAGLFGRLAEVAVRFYDTRMLTGKRSAQPAYPLGQPRAALLRRLPGYQYLKGTVGEFFEANFDRHTSAGPFTTGFDGTYLVHLLIVHRLVFLENHFASLLRDLNFTEAESALTELMSWTRAWARLGAATLNDAQTGGAATNNRIDLEEFSDQLDELITAGELDAFRALYDSYQRRREEVLRRQLFARFQEDHPGLQFKAGTELGGTFVLVYHGGGTPAGQGRTGRFRLVGQVVLGDRGLPGVVITQVNSVSGTLTDQDGRFSLYVDTLPVQLRVQSTPLIIGTIERIVTVSQEDPFLLIDLGEGGTPPNEVPIPGIDNGTVIADFYLPYRCCGRGAPIHIFPPQEPEEPAEPLVATLEQEGCTRMTGGATRLSAAGGFQAPMRLRVSGGTPPYFLQDANGNRQPVPEETLMLRAGLSFTVVDDGGQQVSLTVALLPPLRAQLAGAPTCTDDLQTFSQDFIIEGGRPPYTFRQPDGSSATAEQGEVVTVSGIASGESFTLNVQDAFGEECATTLDFPAHTCVADEPDCGLPCDGIAVRASAPLWAQLPARDTLRYENFRLTVRGLQLTLDDGTTLSLGRQELATLNRNLRTEIDGGGALTNVDYANRMRECMKIIMESTDAAINQPAGLANGEPALRLDSRTEDGPDRLTFQTFACFTFEMVVNVRYTEVDRTTDFNRDRERTLSYSQDGVRESDNAPFPSFERFRIDRCDPNAQPEPECRDLFEVRIQVEGDGMSRSLGTEGGGNRELRFWWDAQMADPGFGEGRKIEVTYSRDGTEVIAAVLAVDPDTGCSATAIARINV
ncbi:hypothetical protein [Neolewinella litorea]|uniref:Carboxypeptidase regulatory-like domain-containing protein n=1 Tax=Neolewinella litorea TaxID=2562452 RepID=A0A4S4NKD2_9BACT|nr:hypothetical protein [Neolewinella litorea]THH39405.1 hypothetical protein E4021_11670 [Neolewinella litorea]